MATKRNLVLEYLVQDDYMNGVFLDSVIMISVYDWICRMQVRSWMHPT